MAILRPWSEASGTSFTDFFDKFELELILEELVRELDGEMNSWLLQCRMIVRG